MISVIGPRVLVKRLPLPEQTQSGLFLLGREYPQVGEVLAVGNGERGKNGERKTIDDLSVGDLVQYDRTGLDTRQVEDETFIIDYSRCLAGMKREGDSYRIWPLGTNVMVRRADVMIN